MSLWKYFGIACIALFLACTEYVAAGTTGKISGKAVDAQTSEPLVGVSVFLTGTTLGAATGIDGTYFIINIPPGIYQLKASSVGYAPFTADGIKVSVDQTTKIDLKLQSTAVEVQGMEIIATRPIVQKDLTSTTATVNSEQMKSLPVEDISAVVNLQAGVVEGHFRGGRSNEVKYLVDGMSVNDVYSGASSLQPEVNSVEEIQVLSGTFNAEYGEALSGVVNQVTKIAGEKYTGQVSAYLGDYITSRSSLYRNIDHISPTDVHNFDANLSGPVPGTDNKLKFFISGRRYSDDGFLYGVRRFNPSDSSNFSANDPSDWYIGATGDGKAVSMNYQHRTTLQGKLNIAIGNAKGITIQGLYQDRNYRQYDQRFVLNPDGDYLYFQRSFLGTIGYNHVFNASSFLDVNGSMFLSDYKQYVYENPLDSRYVNPARMQDAGGASFLTGGTQNWHFSHHTNSYTGKLDFTSQIDNVNQMKVGVETNLHTLRYQDFQIHVDASSGFKPAIAKAGDFDYNYYNNHPYQLSAYAQDKVELEYLIINIGMRFDYFQPDGYVLIDPEQIAALDSLQPPYPSSLVRKASAKSQISPRIGISYPITDRGAIHFSYGHFFQIPAFEFLYRNPNLRIPYSGADNLPDFIGNIIGNADLQPQRTTMYELGLQQELAEDFGVTATAYYKDIRNLLGLEVHEKGGYKKFGEYINRDYGAVRGFTLAFERRMADGFGANLDYTYQIANGDASDPNDAYIGASANPPIPANKQLVPLNWDRRHSINLTLTAGSSNNIIASLISRLGSGLPYTPALQNQRTGLENSDNRPSFFNSDFYITKYFTFGAMSTSVYLKVYNVFDTPNEDNVFTDTGRAGYTLELTRAQQAPRGPNTLAEYYTRPDFYSAPRQIIVGATFSF